VCIAQLYTGVSTVYLYTGVSRYLYTGVTVCLQVRMDETQLNEASELRQRLQQEFELLSAYQSKTRAQLESQLQRERRDLEQRVSLRLAVIQQQVNTSHLVHHTHVPLVTKQCNLVPAKGGDARLLGR